MMLRFGAVALAALAVGSAYAQDTTTDKGKLSYAIGFEVGSDFIEKNLDVDLATVLKGIQDGHAKRTPVVEPAAMREALEKMSAKLKAEAMAKYEALAKENKTKSDQFLAANKVKKGIVTLPNGIQYRVIEDGTGKRPLKTSEVSVHYRGSLTSGLEFDSSFARGTPSTFKVDSVLPGWQDVLPLMKVGDYWQIFLPPEHAYGVRGQGPIGPNETLVFEIKLVDVK